MPISLTVLTIFFIFSSFAFGCNENWSIATCEVILFSGAGLAGLFKRDFFKWPIRLHPIALFVSILIAVCIIQLVPIPVSLYKVFSPERVKAYEDGRKAEELLQSEGYRINPFDKGEIPYESERYTPRLPNYLTITRTPLSTLKALVALLSFFCFLLLLEDLMERGRSELRKLGLVLGFIGLTIGFIALIEKGMEHRTHILWLRESKRVSYAFGPFVNANHGEAFINLTFPIVCYLLWRKVKDENKFSEKLGLVLITLAILILQLSLVVTGFSYGNFLCPLLIPICFLLNIALRRKKRLLVVALLILVVLCICVILFFFKEGAFEYETKRQVFSESLNRLSLLGMGMNSFQYTFSSSVIKWPIINSFRIEYVENEYIQAIYEGGLILLLPIILVVFNVIYTAIFNLSRHRGLFWLSAPILAETIRIFFDMSMHIFPIATLFVVIIAMSYKGQR